MLSQQIKEATKQAHQQLEKIVVQKLKAVESDKDYAQVLSYFYAYFTAIEEQINAYLPESLAPYLQSRRDASYIARDIQELGASLADVPPAVRPEISTTAQAIGALYVLEGSIMGGPYIVKMLEKSGIHKGFHFFSGYGDQSAEKWDLFCQLINAEVQDYDGIALAIMAAQDTFLKFGETFQEKSVGINA